MPTATPILPSVLALKLISLMEQNVTAEGWCATEAGDLQDVTIDARIDLFAVATDLLLWLEARQ